VLVDRGWEEVGDSDGGGVVGGECPRDGRGFTEVGSSDSIWRDLSGVGRQVRLFSFRAHVCWFSHWFTGSFDAFPFFLPFAVFRILSRLAFTLSFTLSFTPFG
jgi:hypothetical protein